MVTICTCFNFITFYLSVKSYKMGRELGINAIAFQAFIVYCFHSFLIGNGLMQLNQEMEKVGNEMPIKYLGFTLLCSTVKIFLGSDSEDGSFNDNNIQGSAKQTSVYNFMLILRACYFHEYDSAASLIQESKLIFKDYYVGTTNYAFFVFYSGLIAACMAKKQEESFYWLQIAKESMFLLKAWSVIVPENFQNKLILLEAEMEVIDENKDKAETLFRESIILSKKYRFVNEEALANEKCAIFHADIGENHSASNYFREALKLYSKWGATAKVRHIKSTYSTYLDDTNALDQFETYELGSELSSILDMLTL